MADQESSSGVKVVNEPQNNLDRQCWIIDSFASPGKLGTGNPAAVVLLTPETNPDDPDSREWMQSVATEFNLSETAFIWSYVCDPSQEMKSGVSDNAEHFHIRYFTRDGSEVDLCGHATLASASVVLHLLKYGQEEKFDQAIFHAKHDILRAKAAAPSVGEGNVSKLATKRIEMDFPWKDQHEITSLDKRSDVITMLRSAFQLQCDPDAASLTNTVVYIGIDNTGEDILVEVTPQFFLSLCSEEKVDFSHMVALDGYTRGIIVCCSCFSEEGIINTESDDTKKQTKTDFMSRFFGPKVGINEDPVTGSAHCILGPYFGAKLGKNKVVGKQMSSRGGIVECTLKAEEDSKRVSIVGTAVTFMSGTLNI